MCGTNSADSLILEEPVPHLYPIRYKELVHFIGSFGNFKGLVKLSEIIISKVRRASAVILNCLEQMERHSLAQFQCEYPQVPSFAIGPLHKIAPTISTSLLSEDIDCMHWLDSQPKNSVIYVSIGSLVTMETSELTEMAWGLASSEQPFLWVIRPGSIVGSQWIEHLPEGFKETVGERGCIVKWAPQKEVLAHDSVGVFLSHCGWNSTLESICEGVPIICRPKFSDQFANARYLSHVWKVGLELEDVLNRENIEKTVKRLMQEPEGEEMRQRAAAFKEMAQVAIAKGGTSYSLNSLVEFLLSL